MASTSQPYYIISPLHPHQNRCDAAKTTARFRCFFNHSFSVSSVAPLKQVVLHCVHLISDECQCCVLIETLNFRSRIYIYTHISICMKMFKVRIYVPTMTQTTDFFFLLGVLTSYIWYKHPSVFCCLCFMSLSQDTPSPLNIAHTTRVKTSPATQNELLN